MHDVIDFATRQLDLILATFRIASSTETAAASGLAQASMSTSVSACLMTCCTTSATCTKVASVVIDCSHNPKRAVDQAQT